MYKYSFEEQILINAQRPDATACASFDLWNNRLNRRINRGAKGIGLLTESNGQYSTKYVFDISDTRDSSLSVDLNIWNYEDIHEESVVNRLNSKYPVKLDEFLDALIKAVNNTVTERSEVLGYEDRIKEILQSSVLYTVMQRCGLETKEHVNTECFDHVIEIKPSSAVSEFVKSVADISGMVLRDIETAVKSNEGSKQNDREAIARRNTNNRDLRESEIQLSEGLRGGAVQPIDEEPGRISGIFDKGSIGSGGQVHNADGRDGGSRSEHNTGTQEHGLNALDGADGEHRRESERNNNRGVEQIVLSTEETGAEIPHREDETENSNAPHGEEETENANAPHGE
jgi:hypothetical protein